MMSMLNMKTFFLRRGTFPMRLWLRFVLPGLLIMTAAGLGGRAAATEVVSADVAIYGGTPAGIAAAIAAGSSGSTVLLVEPNLRIGGLVTNGLSHTDFRTFEGLNGTFLEFSRRVEKHYAGKHGPDSAQVRDCFRGTQGEPRVNLLAFEEMLSEQKTVTVKSRFELGETETTGEGSNRRIVSAAFNGPDGDRLVVQARLFIDATYEGDLMAAAGVPFRVGREAREEYGESLAPEIADAQVQAYNFRFIMTQRAENRVTPVAPAGYRSEDFLPIVPLLEAGRFKSVFCEKSGGIYKAHLPALPNEKHDINDVSRGLVRLSRPDLSASWPDGDAATRRRLFDEQLRYNAGLLYFLQNDPAVPQRFREEARQWGWCRDEFEDTGHIPEQVYVREARRMIGAHVYTERDTEHAPGDARSTLHRDAIATGDYAHNCHGTAHEGPLFGGAHTGEFYKSVAPYQIPYGVIVSREFDNLLVPVACSASHVGFCALRLEPVWMSLGQAAGHAAHLALHENVPVQDVPVKDLQRQLHADGGATIYVSDVSPESPDFAAVQWWGTQGGLHGLAPAPDRPGQRGQPITSQYYEAYPGHRAELEQDLDPAVKRRWLELTGSLGLPDDALREETTRGGFIRRAFALQNTAARDR